MSTFPSWLQNEMQQRGWGQRETARQTGLSQKTILNLLNGTQIPSAKTCQKLADGLGESVDTILRIAEISKGSEPSAIPPEFTEILAAMNPRQQQGALKLLRMFKETTDEEGKNQT